MVHNGIEYGDMQLICEVYQIMKDVLGMGNDEISNVSLFLSQTITKHFIIASKGNFTDLRNYSHEKLNCLTIIQKQKFF